MSETTFKYNKLTFTPKSIELNYSLIKIVKQISNIVEKIKLEETKDIDLTATFKYEQQLIDTKTVLDSLKKENKKDRDKFTKRFTDILKSMQSDTEYLLVKSTYDRVVESAFDMAMYDENIISLVPQLVNEPMTDIKLPSKEGIKLIKEIIRFFFQYLKD